MMRNRVPYQAFIWVQAIVLIACVLPSISQAYWDDEIFSIRTAASLPAMADTFRRYENNMCLYYLLLHGWMACFGDGELATRSLSLLFSIGSLFVFARLARRFLPDGYAFLAGLVLVINPLFLLYSIEVRSYSLLLFLNLGATYLFTRLLDRFSYRDIILYGFFLLAAVYAHYFGFLLLPVHAAVVLTVRAGRDKLRVFLAVWLVVLMYIIPLVVFRPHSLDQINWIRRPGLQLVFETIVHLAGGWGMLSVMVFCALAIASRRGRIFPGNDPLFHTLLPAWFWLPVLSMAVFSVFVKPAFLERYFIGSIPAAAILASTLFREAMRHMPMPRMAWLLILPTALMFSIGPLRQKGSGYRDTAEFIARHAEKNDAVIAYPFMKADHYRFYIREKAGEKPQLLPLAIHSAEYLPGGGGRDPDPDLGRVDSLSRVADRVFLVCNNDFLPSDHQLNKVWLPSIDSILRRSHSIRDTLVFGEALIQPTRLIIYRRSAGILTDDLRHARKEPISSGARQPSF
jgi:hypothetical protein